MLTRQLFLHLNDFLGEPLTRKQLAQLITLSEGAIGVREHGGQPILPKIKLSERTVRYRRSDLERLLAPNAEG
jgi:hypothetical protein